MFFLNKISIFNNIKSLFISLILVTFLFIIISIALVWYLICFYKQTFYKKFINKKSILFINIILGLTIIIIFFNYMFGFIFYILSTIIITILTIISFILIVCVGIYLFLFLHTIVIGINENEIMFLGEKILINKIICIQKNEKLNQLIIFYWDSIYSFKKKYKYSLFSKPGEFIINNINLLNQTLEIISINNNNK